MRGEGVIHVLDILLQLIRVCSAVQEHVFDTGIRKELQCILNQGGVR